MPHFTLLLDAQNGPLVTAFIGPSAARVAALEQAGAPVPKPISIRALVDTGASATCVDPLITTQLALTPTGKTPIYTPSTGNTPYMADQYDIRLFIPGATTSTAPLVIPNIPVFSSLLASQGIQALIGRDVLNLCVLMYNGEQATFTLAY